MQGQRIAIVGLAVTTALGVTACGGGSSSKQAVTCPAGNVKASRSVPWSSVYANVYNASDTTGKAAQVAGQLKWRGLRTLDVGNDPLADQRPAPKSAEIRYGTAGRTIALNIAAQIPHATLFQDSRSDPTVDIVIGNGFSLLPRPVSAKQDVQVSVYNTTVVSGLAETAVRALGSQGYKARSVSNDGSYYPDDEAVIVYNEQGLPAAQRLAMNFSKARLVKAADAPHAKVDGAQVHLYLGSKWPVDHATVLPAGQATTPPKGAVVNPAC